MSKKIKLAESYSSLLEINRNQLDNFNLDSYEYFLEDTAEIDQIIDLSKKGCLTIRHRQNMNKNGTSKAKYCIQSEKHPHQTTVGLCSLLEHQSLVDIVICCGSNVLHAHKAVLAASSPLFREELEKNPGTEQVIISGCEFSIIRSLIEFIYCGETIIDEEFLKYLVAAARLFQMKSLENLALDYYHAGTSEIITLPKPQFISKKPKYPTYPFNQSLPMNTLKPQNFNVNNLYKQHKVKRRFRMEAEHQACVKEAQASQLAIANLKKEIASAPQSNTFIIEETCTETTVENFIPHEQPNFVEVDIDNINNQMFINPQQFNNHDPSNKSNVIQLTVPNNGQPLTADKIKNILGNNENPNVEIMFKTSDGNYITVTDDVLQNLQKDGLQYQVIDEDGRVGEIQELQILGKDQKEGDLTLSKEIQSANVVPSENFNNFFGTPSVILSNSNIPAVRPSDLNLNVDSKEIPIKNNNIEFLTLNPMDIKTTYLAPSVLENTSFQSTNGYINESTSEPHNMKEEELDITDNVVMVTEDGMKSRASLKFSPDIFFADMTNQEIEGSDKKKLCLNQQK